jgi:hypothetical protein
MGMKDWSEFERVALVTDHSAFRELVKLFGFLMPGEVKVYSMDERDDATTWVSA